MSDRLKESWVQEMEYRNSPFGPVLYIRIARHDMRPMGWEELWERFERAYPDRWAIQVFPPVGSIVNDANCYHLFVLDKEITPRCFQINR